MTNADSRRGLDLYLGSDLGGWALDHLPLAAVRQVITLDEALAAQAAAAGLVVHLGDANALVLDTSPVALSVHYPKILRPPLLGRYQRAYNIHPGYLPWGRGYYPVFWALWEGTPAGATLHEMAPAVDAGPIVAQIQVTYSERDTGGSLFARVRAAEQRLLSEYWPRICAGEPLPSAPQPAGGTTHLRREFFELKRAVSLPGMTAEHLVRLARCLTFPGHTGLELVLGGQRWELRLEPLHDPPA
ncbi:MAG TPA: formyltransferase family protein [Roseiflexaceae bacterium]|nr:formyltransferase family protein [Roseiflexaceae bacterium]